MPQVHGIRSSRTPSPSTTPMLCIKPSAIPRVLAIVEVLELIFDHIFPGDEQMTSAEQAKIQTQTLARAARTCKMFMEPALRILWRYLYSLAPILSMIKHSPEAHNAHSECFVCRHVYRFHDFLICIYRYNNHLLG